MNRNSYANHGNSHAHAPDAPIWLKKDYEYAMVWESQSRSHFVDQL